VSREIVRVDDGWRVPTFRGLGVSELAISRELRLRFGSHQIELHSWSELLADEQTYRLAAWPQTNLGKATELLGQVVSEFSASDRGVLRILFAGGWCLTVPPDDERSAWNVSVRFREFLHVRPGGEVRVSGPREIRT
jgi:hypothetical protein